MATESVDIIISAQDNATVVLRKAAENAKRADADIRNLGRAYGSAGDAISKAARAMGGGWMVDAGRNLKDIAEGAGKVRDALRESSAAATALKWGLAGVAGIVSFKIGKSVGDLIWDTKSGVEEMAAARARDVLLQERQNKELYRQLQLQKEIIGLEVDGERQRQLLLNERQRITRDIVDKEKFIAAQQAVRDAMPQGLWIDLPTANQREDRKTVENNISGEKERLAILKQQETAIRDMLAPEALAHEARKKANAELRASLALQQSISDEIARETMSAKDFDIMMAKRITANDIDREALGILIEKKHALLEQERLAKEKKQSDEEQARLQKEMAKAEEERFHRRARLWEEDLEAAAKVRAQRAELITNDLLEDLENAKGRRVSTDRTQLSALESRMLTGRTSTLDTDRQALELAKKNAAVQEASRKLLQNAVTNLQTIARNLGIPDQVWEAN